MARWKEALAYTRSRSWRIGPQVAWSSACAVVLLAMGYRLAREAPFAGAFRPPPKPPQVRFMMQPDVPRKTAKQVCDALQSAQAPVIVDVREDWEFAQAHIKGAVWVPLSRLQEKSEQLIPAKNRPLVTYCHHGVRSAKAAAWLIEHGFADVSSMDGGIDAWATDVDHSVGRY